MAQPNDEVHKQDFLPFKEMEIMDSFVHDVKMQVGLESKVDGGEAYRFHLVELSRIVIHNVLEKNTPSSMSFALTLFENHLCISKLKVQTMRTKTLTC